MTGFSLIPRRMRRRFGIAAQTVAVRSELPWPVRAGVWVAIFSLSFAIGAWLYDSGRRFAGFDRSETEREITRLNESVRTLQAELAALRTVARTSDSRLRLEATTQDELASQVRALQRENAALKEDLALFEGLVSGDSHDAGARIDRAAIEQSIKAGSWRYSVLIVNASSGKSGQEMTGTLQFEFMVRLNGKDVTITIPSAAAGGDRIHFTVKHFRRLDGEFLLPEGAVVNSGEVRLVQDGVVRVRRQVMVQGMKSDKEVSRVR